MQLYVVTTFYELFLVTLLRVSLKKKNKNFKTKCCLTLKHIFGFEHLFTQIVPSVLYDARPLNLPTKIYYTLSL